MVASARSPSPETETTVPSPNVSWVTRSPGVSETTARAPGALAPIRAAAATSEGAAPNPPLLGATDVVTGESGPPRRQSMSSAGISSRKREAGKYDGEPHWLRTTARET